MEEIKNKVYKKTYVANTDINMKWKQISRIVYKIRKICWIYQYEGCKSCQITGG